KLRRQNSLAYSYLVGAVSDTCFGFVNSARTTELPEGNAAMAWKTLTEKFESDTPAAKIELKREFASKVLEKGQDPDEWLVELEHLRRRLESMGSAVADEDMIAHVLSHLTAEYSELVT
ncbi:unnamed protein product, partial [Chrysoparadoxa australica]